MWQKQVSSYQFIIENFEVVCNCIVKVRMMVVVKEKYFFVEVVCGV